MNSVDPTVGSLAITRKNGQRLRQYHHGHIQRQMHEKKDTDEVKFWFTQFTLFASKCQAKPGPPTGGFGISLPAASCACRPDARMKKPLHSSVKIAHPSAGKNDPGTTPPAGRCLTSKKTASLSSSYKRIPYMELFSDNDAGASVGGTDGAPPASDIVRISPSLPERSTISHSFPGGLVLCGVKYPAIAMTLCIATLND